MGEQEDLDIREVKNLCKDKTKTPMDVWEFINESAHQKIEFNGYTGHKVRDEYRKFIARACKWQLLHKKREYEKVKK
jgi:hypothetical protein